MTKFELLKELESFDDDFFVVIEDEYGGWSDAMVDKSKLNGCQIVLKKEIRE